MHANTDKIVGLYGFKGGVGRTLAAAHLADLYSRLGQRVLLVDADLEAPGLTFWKAPRLGEREDGLVQLLNHLGDVHEDDISSLTLLPYIRGGSDFFSGMSFSAERQSASGKLGTVHLMPAGLGETSRSLTSYLAELPRAETEVLRVADKLKRALSLSDYDIVLVDSRPGIHPIGATLFSVLADYNVVLFGPSRQAMRGLKTALDLFRPEQLTKMVLALSPVAWFAGEKIEDAQALLANYHLIESNATQPVPIVPISWHPALALDEQLITVTDRHSATARDYRRLLQELETVRGYGIDQHTRAVDALLDIFKASVAVDGPERGVEHLRAVFRQESGIAFFGAAPKAVATVQRHLDETGESDPWSRREFVVELLVWEIIRRLRNLARLDREASEALWAIVIRRNFPAPDSPRDPEDNNEPLKPMEKRYEQLYEQYSAAEMSLPILLNSLHVEYREEFGQALRDHQLLTASRSQPDYAASIGAFADLVGRMSSV